MDAVYFAVRIGQVLGIVLAATLSIAEVEEVLVVKDNSASVVRTTFPFGRSDDEFLKGACTRSCEFKSSNCRCPSISYWLGISNIDPAILGIIGMYGNIQKPSLARCVKCGEARYFLARVAIFFEDEEFSLFFCHQQGFWIDPRHAPWI